MAVTSAAASAAAATKALSAAAAVTKVVLPWVVPVLLGTAAVTVGVVATRGGGRAEESAPRPVSSSAETRTIGRVPAMLPPERPRPPATRDDAPRSTSPSSVVAHPIATAERAQSTDQARELSGELRLLDAANRALAEGDLAAASADLDRYARDFPKGTLAEEALAIRVRVWTRSGDRERAQALYERLARTYPASPYLESLREALGLPPAGELRPPSP
jgi:TolA-binding protein